MRKFAIMAALISILLLSGCHPYPPTINGMAADDHPATNACYTH